jgi:DNA (cytosine-5)-methyltransferase 1
VKPRLLDLFCGAGGAGMGYHRAGFEVVGVDLSPQPRYPFEFRRMDALTALAHVIYRHDGWEFDAIHASPPCQVNSALRSLWPGRVHPNLVAPTRGLLAASGLPWVMENVPGADMGPAVVLCGSQFGLGATCRDGVRRQLRRHRLFEVGGFSVMSPPCVHRGQPVGVYGHGGGGAMTRGYKGTRDEYREAMGINWATKAEIAQAIPPAYTEHIGGYLMAAVQKVAA